MPDPSNSHTARHPSVCLRRRMRSILRYLLFSMNEFVASIHILFIDFLENIGDDVLITVNILRSEMFLPILFKGGNSCL